MNTTNLIVETQYKKYRDEEERREHLLFACLVWLPVSVIMGVLIVLGVVHIVGWWR